jgi:hypothetical protein
VFALTLSVEIFAEKKLKVLLKMLSISAYQQFNSSIYARRVQGNTYLNSSCSIRKYTVGMILYKKSLQGSRDPPAYELSMESIMRSIGENMMDISNISATLLYAENVFCPPKRLIPPHLIQF